MNIFFSNECLDYFSKGHPESPDRIKLVHKFLEYKKFSFLNVSSCSLDDLLLAHSEDLISRVKQGDFLDPDTPAHPRIFHYACLAVGSAIQSAHSSLDGETAFSLMRPPGHHATRDHIGGFCYFNNIAIAVLRVKKMAGKIAVIDLDCHHGNGTQDILFGREGIIYVSLHQSPLYPGTGLTNENNCFNYPLEPETNSEEYLSVLNEALGRVSEFNPDLIAVSMGFDTYAGDPISSLDIKKSTYFNIGEKLSGLNKPLFSVLEGGYNTSDMPECISDYLSGLSC